MTNNLRQETMKVRRNGKHDQRKKKMEKRGREAKVGRKSQERAGQER